MTESQEQIAGLLLLAGWHGVTSFGALGVLRKAGAPTGMAFVPVANFVHLCRVAGISGWWVATVVVPGLNVVAAVYAGIRLARRFSLSELFGVALALTAFLLLPVLGYNAAAYRPQEDADQETDPAAAGRDGRRGLTTAGGLRPLLIALSVVYGLLIVGAPGLWIVCVMAFDAPGSQDNTALVYTVATVAAAPVTCLVALIIGWVLYARRRHRAALIVAVLPCLHVLAFGVGLAWLAMSE